MIAVNEEIPYFILQDLGKTVVSLDQFSDRMSHYKLNQDSAQPL